MLTMATVALCKIADKDLAICQLDFLIRKRARIDARERTRGVVNGLLNGEVAGLRH